MLALSHLGLECPWSQEQMLRAWDRVWKGSSALSGMRMDCSCMCMRSCICRGVCGIKHAKLGLKTQSWVQADRDGEGSPTESGMSMDSIPMRKRSRKPKHVYNAADVAPLQAPWKASTFKPKKVCHLPTQML